MIMATRKAGKTGRARPSTARSKPGAQSARFKKIGKTSSQIVMDAAALLDEEIASGIVAAKQVQQRFARDRRIDPSDFKGALKKFQGDAHQVVNMLNGQFSGLRSRESTQLVNRFTRNTHNLLDLVVELVNTGAKLADQLAQSKLNKKQGVRNGKAGR
jgi:hypothetical protein